MKDFNKNIIIKLLRSGQLFTNAKDGIVYRTRSGGNGLLKTPMIVKGCKSCQGYIKTTIVYHKKLYTIFLHHIIYLSVNFDIPHNMTIDHINNIKSDNRICNLQTLTQKDNYRKAVKDGLLNTPKGETHSRAKLTNRQVLDIRRICSQGKATQIQIAKQFNVSPSNICLIVNNKSRT